MVDSEPGGYRWHGNIDPAAVQALDEPDFIQIAKDREARFQAAIIQLCDRCEDLQRETDTLLPATLELAEIVQALLQVLSGRHQPAS